MLHVWLVDHPEGPYATRINISPAVLARLIGQPSHPGNRATIDRVLVRRARNSNETIVPGNMGSSARKVISASGRNNDRSSVDDKAVRT